MGKKVQIDETVARCPKCLEASIYYVGEDHKNIEWFRADRAKILKDACCANCKHITNSETIVEIVCSTRIYHNNTAYSVKEVAEKFILVIRSPKNIALHKKENFNPNEPTLFLSPIDREKVLKAMGITIHEKETDEENKDQSSTVVGSIKVGSISAGSGPFIGSNNISSTTKNGIKFTYAVFGSNMIIEDSQ